MDFGYGRVSTKDQNTARQKDILKDKCNKYFEDKQTGKNMDRPQFKEMMAQLRAGDTVVVLSVDRLGRNTRELISVCETLKEKGVNIVAISQGIDTSTKVGEIFFMLMAIFAQLELEFISERQRGGIEVAKKEGKFMGRPQKMLQDDFKKLVTEVDSGQLTVERACKLLGVSRSTFYRRKERLVSESISDDTEIDF